MPHDANGNVIKNGDRVKVAFIVKEVYQGEEYCNCSLETVHPMYPGEHKTALTVNTRQVELDRPEAESADSAA